MRLDQALVRRGLARSRGQASEAVRSGGVRVNGRPVNKPAATVADDDRIEIAAADHYVSRAAHKLLGALTDSGLPVRGRVLDAGASTGGFTQVALECGAERVYAIDVGHGQLAARVREDPRVVAREGLNLRELSLDDLDGQPVYLIVGDVSFISLKLLLAPLLAVLHPDGAADPAPRLRPAQPPRPLRDLVHTALPYPFVADHAAGVQSAPADLELRLHQQQRGPVRLQDGE